MNKEISGYPINVHLIFKRNNSLLFLKRQNTGMHDGFWCLPVGKMDKNETPKEAIIRETKEEIGVNITNPQLATIIATRQPNYYDKNKIWYDINMFFIIEDKNMSVYNAEPEKHSDINFFNFSDLPKIIPITAQGIKQYQENIPYGEYIV